LAQRLVRRICSQCREEVEPSEAILADLEISAERAKDLSFYRGKGCEACNNTGYKGRVGLFELMILNDELREMIMANCSTDELRVKAEEFGMVTLRIAGENFAFNGTTTAEEVIRETILDA
jgi:type IV pilus assembly protein PilB